MKYKPPRTAAIFLGLFFTDRGWGWGGGGGGGRGAGGGGGHGPLGPPGSATNCNSYCWRVLRLGTNVPCML